MTEKAGLKIRMVFHAGGRESFFIYMDYIQEVRDLYPDAEIEVEVETG